MRYVTAKANTKYGVIDGLRLVTKLPPEAIQIKYGVYYSTPLMDSIRIFVPESHPLFNVRMLCNELFRIIYSQLKSNSARFKSTDQVNTLRDNMVIDIFKEQGISELS